MEFPSLIDWASPFPFKGMLRGIYHLHSHLSKTFCKQKVETLISRHILQSINTFTVLFVKIKQIFMPEIFHNLEISTRDPLKYKMDNSILILLKSIRMKKVYAIN